MLKIIKNQSENRRDKLKCIFRYIAEKEGYPQSPGKEQRNGRSIMLPIFKSLKIIRIKPGMCRNEYL